MFLSHPLGGLGTTYDVHLGLIGKCIVDFPFVIIELFTLDVMAEALRAKIDRKSAISLQRSLTGLCCALMYIQANEPSVRLDVLIVVLPLLVARASDL